MTGHTKEPWRVGLLAKFKIFGADNAVAVAVLDLAGPEIPHANARRIVAAVNACEGIATKDLETMQVAGHMYSTAVELRSLAEQQGELLAALEASKAYIENYGMKTESILAMAAKYQKGIAVLAQIDSAIAKARGKA